MSSHSHDAANLYMVVSGGVGDYHSDFTVSWHEANSPWEAAKIAVSPEQGYGRRDGTPLYVIAAADVHTFSTVERLVLEIAKTEEAEGA